MEVPSGRTRWSESNTPATPDPGVAEQPADRSEPSEGQTRRRGERVQHTADARLSGAGPDSHPSIARRMRLADTGWRVPSPWANWLTRSSSSSQGTSGRGRPLSRRRS